MPTSVKETLRAQQQVDHLRKKDRRVYEQFLGDLQANGCGALAYRLTGEAPISRLCVKHLGGKLRVVVEFESETQAWVVIVGPHDDKDPNIDVYAELYRLAGLSVPPVGERKKPSCCDSGGLAPYLSGGAQDLADKATRLRRTRR